MFENNNQQFLTFVKKILRKLRPRFSFHYVAYTVLSFIVIFSVVQLVGAATPNPGHPWSEVGDGVFTFTNGQTVTNYTYTFPAANTTVLTTNALVTVAQGGTNAGSFTGNGVVYANSGGTALTSVVNATGSTLCLTQVSSGTPTWATCTSGGIRLDQITAANTTNTINNVANAQEWQWNSLGSGTGFKISSNSTGALSDTQKLFQIALSGANANSTQTTTALSVSNIHTGTGSTNVAFSATASGGSTENFAAIFDGRVESHGTVDLKDDSAQLLVRDAAGTNVLFHADVSSTNNVGIGTLASSAARLDIKVASTPAVGLRITDGADNYLTVNAIAPDSNFFGTNAGDSSPGATNSNFLGQDAGNGATDAAASNFLGQEAGQGATDASESNFFGTQSGDSALNASASNFFGSYSGRNAVDSLASNFLGYHAGEDATTAPYSNFFGYYAGYSADLASNSIFIGRHAGYTDAVDNTGNADDFSILIGKDTGTGGNKNSIAIGGSATNTAQNQLMIGSSTRGITQVVINGTSAYLNFGATGGTSGYGFRDNGGNMEFKNSGGSWAAFGTGSGGVTTMGTFGSTPNANGGSISGVTLTLQPADATNPGGVSTTTQTFAGAKTFAGPSNTAVGFKITDGTNSYFTVNTQTATSAISAFTFANTAPTIASASGAQFIQSTFTPGIFNFTGTTNITGTTTASILATLHNQPTINGNNTNTITEASNVLINGAVKTSSSSGTLTLTNSYGLQIPAVSVNGTNGAVTNAYGLSVSAPTGASNNYAAVFPTGNVGIGTSAPISKLHMYDSTSGTVTVKTENSVSKLDFGVDSTSTFIQARTAANAVQNLLFYTGASETMRLNSGGELQIGSTSDLGAFKLQVTGDSDFVGIATHVAQSTTALTVARTGSTYALQVDTNTASSVTGLKITAAAAGAGLALSEIGGNTDENLTIDAKGAGTISLGATSTGSVLFAGGFGSTGCSISTSGALSCDSTATIGSSSSAVLSNASLTTATSFTVGNSSSALTLGGSSGNVVISSTTSSPTAIRLSPSLDSTGSSGTLGNTSFTTTSGDKYDWRMTSGFAPTSGTGTFTNLFFNGTINQTGGANGITRAIDINPTLTAVADFRAVMIENNSASSYGIYQSGSSTKNYFAGNTSIGSTTTTSLFNVGSSAQFQVTSGGAIAAATGVTSSGTITFSGLGGGGTKCVQTDNAGVITAAAAACGSGGAPAWDTITAPTTSNLSLAHGAFTTAFTFNSVTTATAFALSSSSLSSGTLFDLSVNSTAATSNTQKGLNISIAGANSNSNQNTYGAYISNTHTGTGARDYGIYAESTLDATSNYGIWGQGHIGVRGSSVGFTSNPIGVYGSGGAASNAKGVYGDSQGNTGSGVYGGWIGSGSGNVTGYGVYGDTSGALVNTTTGDAFAYAGYFSSTASEVAGSNILTNIGLYATASGGDTNYAAIFDGGNVGIGTTTPGAKLNVVGTMIQSGGSTSFDVGMGTFGILTSTYSDGIFHVDETNGTVWMGDKVVDVNGTFIGLDDSTQQITLDGGINLQQRVVSGSSYTALADDYTILVDTSGAGGTYTVNIPDAATTLPGRIITVKYQVTGNPIEIVDAAANKIDNSGSPYTLSTVYQSATFQSDGANWWSIGEGRAGGGSGANTALSNLTTTAINTSLLSATDNTYFLGDVSNRWKGLYLGGTGIISDGSYTQSTGTMSITSNNASGTSTSSAFALNANSLTSGTGMYLASTSLTSGRLLDLSVNSAATTGQVGLNLVIAGANSGSSVTTYSMNVGNTHTGTSHISYGGSFSATGSGTTSTNIGLYASASNGTNNYAAIFPSGNVGVGNSAPGGLFSVGSSSQFQIDSSGVITAAAGITSSGTITLSSLGGSGTKCVETNNAGVIVAAAAACGSGGGLTVGTTAITSGGTNRVLYENGSNVLSESANYTYDGTTLGVSTASTTASNKALNISQTGATSGTDYAGYFSNTGAATTNIGIYATATGATNNYAGVFEDGRVLIGTASDTTSIANIFMSRTLTTETGSTGLGVAGIHQNFTFNPTSGTPVQIGNRLVVSNTGTAVTTAEGQIIRMDDTPSSGTPANLIRGLEVVASVGSNTAGTNTGIRSTGKTFGVQAITTGAAGGVAVPAGLYAENTGTTQGDVARFYTGTMTSAASMLDVYHDTSTFTGDALLMDMAVGSGTFSGNFLDLKNAGVLKFKVTSAGVVSMGLSGTASTNAVCSSLANTTAPTAGTAYEIRDCNAAPAADYAEMYPVESGVEFGDIVATGSEMVNTYDSTGGNVDWTKVKGKVTRLIKSNKNYQSNVIGIVADNYGDFTSAGHNIKDTDNPMPVALNGRVPVKVSSLSQSIAPGDYITTSDEGGKATKATKGGFVIGKALEAWTPNSGASTVMIYVEQGFYNGQSISEFAGISGASGTFARQVLQKFLADQQGGNTSSSELVLDRLAVGIVITPKVVADNVELNKINAGESGDIGLILGANGKFTIDGQTTTQAPAITFDSLGNATFTGTVTAKKIQVADLAGIQAITDQINNLTQGQEAFTLTATVMNTLSGALTTLQANVTALQADVDGTNTTVAGLVTSGTDMDTRLQAVEALLSANAFSGLNSLNTNTLTVTGGASFGGEAIFNGLVNFANNSMFNSQAEFVVPPLYNKDTAGYALVKQGDKRVHVVFSQAYIATPVVNTSVTFETSDNVDDAQATALFTNDVRFIIVSKDQTGFTILLNKPAPRDIRFSWNALQVKDPQIFQSIIEGIIIDPTPSSPPPTTPEEGTPPQSGTDNPPVEGDGSTPPTSPDPTTPPTDSGDTTNNSSGDTGSTTAPTTDGADTGSTTPSSA